MKRFVLLLLLLCATPVHATVNEVFARNDYVGNASTTSFPYTFRIINQADVLVLLNGVLQTLNIQYTVIGVDNPGGGAVVFAAAPPSGEKVALLRAQRFQQLSIYTPNEAFPAKRIESDLDKNSMVDQRQQEEIGRALKFDPFSLYRDVFVDDPVAGKCLAWNAARTRVVAADCSGGAGGVGTGNVIGDGVAGQVTFWTGTNTIAGDGKFLWNNASKFLTVGTFPIGPAKPGNTYMGLVGPTDATGMQNLQLQTVQGDPSLIGLVTLGNDRVGLSSWNFRGAGADNPIYGANFGVVFNTNGVANGLEIDVQNDTTTNFQGQALWLNGSTRAAGAPGTVGHRANAILIDTQDGSKWERGILFKEGFVANGATGSIEKMGIHFENSQDADFIVIQPRLGTASNVAVKVTNPSFTLNRFELLNSGTLRVSNSMTGPAFPSYSFIEGAGPTAGMYLEAVGIAAVPPGPGGIPPAVPASGGVLGWAVNSVRRMTLGDALNVYPVTPTVNNGGTVNLWDQFSAHSVGFMSPDFVGTSFRIKLPNAPGAAGQCVITSGGFPIESWSYAACGTGGGGGGSGTVTNTGVLTLNALVLGNGGVDIKPMASLGTTTTVLHGNVAGAPVFGPVVVADISATGTPSSSTFLRGDGVWGTVGGSGTVTTSGSPLNTQVPFFTSATAISGSPKFRWTGAQQLAIGTGADPASVSQALQVMGRSTGGGDPAMISYAAFAGASPTVNFPVAMSLIGDFTGGGAMPLGFGVTLEFGTHDYAGNSISNAFINSTTTLLSPAAATMTFGVQQGGVATTVATLSGILATFPNTPVQVGAVSTPLGAGLGSAIFGASASTNITTPVAILEANQAGTSALRTALMLRRVAPAGQMVDGFGVRQDFVLRDADGVDNINARFTVGRSGIDSTGTFSLQTAIGGVLADRVTINSTGQFTFFPTATVGSFQLAANGTRTTELQFFTNNNTNVVALVAPATSTGNFTWKLPTTFGAAGSIMTNDGSGQLAWETFPAGLVLTSLQIGPTPAGTTSSGPLKVSVSNSDNVNPFQSILAQMVNGSSTGISNILVANDKAAVAGQAWRGAGGTSPIYGGVFNVAYSSAGIANAVEVGVINTSGSVGGQGLWVNGNGTTNRDNGILIDAQTSAKWVAGIRFSEGNVGGGATGSISQFGIIFDKSQDADFLVIRPRVGANNSAIRITDPAFSVNRFTVSNLGDVAFSGALTSIGATSLGVNSISITGGFNTSGNVGANQYFSNGAPGFGTPTVGTTKTLGTCTIKIAGGIIIDWVGGPVC